jgi:hypothetical protein
VDECRYREVVSSSIDPPGDYAESTLRSVKQEITRSERRGNNVGNGKQESTEQDGCPETGHFFE